MCYDDNVYENRQTDYNVWSNLFKQRSYAVQVHTVICSVGKGPLRHINTNSQDLDQGRPWLRGALTAAVEPHPLRFKNTILLTGNFG